MKFAEVKRHLNKPDETYLCDLVGRGADFVVLKYVSDRDWQVAGQPIPAGTSTFAYYRAAGGSVVWKMVGPQGNLTGYLFHICKELEIQEDRVIYLDLLLDLWFDPTGECTVLDRDELEDSQQKGQVSKNDLAWIFRHEREIVQEFERIVSDLDHLIHRLLPTPGSF